MKILGLIPARGGSKGVPKKNIKLLGDKSLIAYTIESAQQSREIHTTIISTDSDDIFQVADSLGLQPPFIRPEHLAQDTTSSLDVVQHAIAFFEDQHIFFDAVCLLQPTNPFRENGFIDQAIAKFTASNADSLVSVLPIPHEYNPHWAFEENENGFLQIATGEEKIISRRQELPKAYFRDGAIYITKTAVIKSGSLYGNSIAYIHSNPEWHVNIDTIEDWEKAESLLKTKIQP